MKTGKISIQRKLIFTLKVLFLVKFKTFVDRMVLLNIDWVY